MATQRQARTATIDPADHLRRIRKEQQGKGSSRERVRLRIMIAGDPLRPIRTISLPSALPTAISIFGAILIVGTIILACGSWRLSDARAALERRVMAMIQAADSLALGGAPRAGDDADKRNPLTGATASARLPPGPTGRFVVQASNTGEEMEIRLNLRTGEIDAESYRRFRHLMRCLHTTAETPIDPRLIELLYRIAERTKQKIILVSGFRAPMYSLAKLSYHTRGMAADIRIPGMTALMARDLAESMGVHGLGYYPVSGFIHVDVRDHRMRWTDYGENRFDSERVEHGTAHGEVTQQQTEPDVGSEPGSQPSATLAE